LSGCFFDLRQQACLGLGDLQFAERAFNKEESFAQAQENISSWQFKTLA
jgi:hypothetical protein